MFNYLPHKILNVLQLMLISLLTFGMLSCAADTAKNMMDDGDSVILGSINCVDDGDCDGDGLNATCDADDADVQNVNIIPSCDEDEDGFVDVLCNADQDLNGDGFITADERNINCDVCPGVYDPEQLDENQDGMGDACDAFLNINESVPPPADPVAQDSGALFVDGDMIGAITNLPASVKRGQSLIIDVQIENNSLLDEFAVNLVLIKSIFNVQPALQQPSTDVSIEPAPNILVSYSNFAAQQLLIPTDQISTHTLHYVIPKEVALANYTVKLVVTYRDENKALKTAETIYGPHKIKVDAGSVFTPAH